MAPSGRKIFIAETKRLCLCPPRSRTGAPSFPANASSSGMSWSSFSGPLILVMLSTEQRFVASAPQVHCNRTARRDYAREAFAASTNGGFRLVSENIFFRPTRQIERGAHRQEGKAGFRKLRAA